MLQNPRHLEGSGRVTLDYTQTAARTRLDPRPGAGSDRGQGEALAALRFSRACRGHAPGTLGEALARRFRSRRWARAWSILLYRVEGYLCRTVRRMESGFVRSMGRGFVRGSGGRERRQNRREGHAGRNFAPPWIAYLAQIDRLDPDLERYPLRFPVA